MVYSTADKNLIDKLDETTAHNRTLEGWIGNINLSISSNNT